MPDRKYYVISDDNCKFESLTKEEVLTAIAQAIESGEISDVDTGFVTTIKETNHNVGLKFWYGTQAEYNALQSYDAETYYIIKDDTRLDAIEAQLVDEMTAYHTVVETVNDYGERLTSMSHTVDVNTAKVDELQYTVRQLQDDVNDFNEAVVEPRNKIIYSASNPAIDYGEGLSVAMARDISKYAIIRVYAQAVGNTSIEADVLCSVADGFIRGAGFVPYGNATDVNSVININIALSVNSDNAVTENKSSAIIYDYFDADEDGTDEASFQFFKVKIISITGII